MPSTRRTGHGAVRPRFGARHPPSRPGDAAQPLHAGQHVLRLLRDPGVDPWRVPAGRRPHRPVDHLRHHRRRGRPAGRRDHAVRPAVRLAGRPGVLRPGAGPAAPSRCSPQGRDEWDPLGWIACFVWLACAAIRLARFNTTVDPTADKRYFTGLPSPGAAGVVLASVFAFGDQMQGRDRLWVLLVVVVPALLMVSNVRFRSFRSLVSPKSGKPYGLIALAVVLVVGFALGAGDHRRRARLRLPAGAAAAARSSRRWPGCCRPG